jgi:hypothetical protein
LNPIPLQLHNVPHLILQVLFANLFSSSSTNNLLLSNLEFLHLLNQFHFEHRQFHDIILQFQSQLLAEIIEHNNIKWFIALILL